MLFRRQRWARFFERKHRAGRSCANDLDTRYQTNNVTNSSPGNMQPQSCSRSRLAGVFRGERMAILPSRRIPRDAKFGASAQAKNAGKINVFLTTN